MIREDTMAAGQRDFGHVAGDTFCLAYRASLRHRSRDCFLCIPCRRVLACRVAGQAFRIVELDAGALRLMRIMAGDAADSAIRSKKASAICKPVGLEAHIRFSVPVVAHDRIPCAMALPTKF